MRREPPSAERHARWCERDLIVTYSIFRHGKSPISRANFQLVGTMGFEPMTPSTPRKCATKLRYVPNAYLIGLTIIVE